MKLYGLFEYSYDWYEWETLICVSKSKDKLIKTFNALDTNLSLICEEDHNETSSAQTNHYMIKEVRVV